MAMGKGRIEAFSDGVIAIIITIMVLEMKAPHTADWEGVRPLLPVLLSYVLSFVYVGIYWNNHHHLFQAVKGVEGKTLWANLHLLFWMSLIPFVTGWMGETHFAKWPVVAYGCVLVLCAVAWQVLCKVLVKSHGEGSAVARAVGVGNTAKEGASVALYVVGIGLAVAAGDASWGVYAACAAYCAVAVVWIVPDRRVERALGTGGTGG